jgi:hypothetical protein
MRTHFPQEYSALATRLAGKSARDGRLILLEALESFQRRHIKEIIAAPGATLIALESRHGAMLRSLQARDMRLCSLIGDRGFFSPEARAHEPPEGLDDYAVALVEAAVAGRGQAPHPGPTANDFEAWMVEVERRGTQVPVRAMLRDRALRTSASAEHLCVGAALMHEAATRLPPEQALRVSAALAKSTLAAGSSLP